MIRSPLRFAAFAAVLGAALPAWAQAPAGGDPQAALRQHCTNDYMRLCSAFNPGSRELEQCFQARMNDLSPNCRGAIADYTKTNSPGAAPARR